MQQIDAKKVYKSWHDWVEKVIRWELSKKLKSDHANGWYINNSEFIEENETHKVLWDIEI